MVRGWPTQEEAFNHAVLIITRFLDSIAVTSGYFREHTRLGSEDEKRPCSVDMRMRLVMVIQRGLGTPCRLARLYAHSVINTASLRTRHRCR